MLIYVNLIDMYEIPGKNVFVESIKWHERIIKKKMNNRQNEWLSLSQLTRIYGPRVLWMYMYIILYVLQYHDDAMIQIETRANLRPHVRETYTGSALSMLQRGMRYCSSIRDKSTWIRFTLVQINCR